MSLIARILWVIASVIIGALVLRFIFMVLGADPAHDFVALIYDFSRPFVVPFVGIFGERQGLAGSRQIEVATLIAIAVYAILASILSNLFPPARTVV